MVRTCTLYLTLLFSTTHQTVILCTNRIAMAPAFPRRFRPRNTDLNLSLGGEDATGQSGGIPTVWFFDPQYPRLRRGRHGRESQPSRTDADKDGYFQLLDEYSQSLVRLGILAHSASLVRTSFICT